MDSSESWHFAQLSTQAFGNMAPLGRPLPSLSGFRPTLEAKISAQSGYFDHNAENARSDFRHSQKSIHCARRNFDFYSFTGKRGPQGNNDAQIGHTLGHSRGGTQRPQQPASLNGRAHRALRAYRAPRASSTESGMKKAPLLGPSQSVVRAKGLEPSRGCPHMDLNHTRLPIPPRPRDFQ